MSGANELGFIGGEACHSTSVRQASELGFIGDDSVKQARGSHANELGFIFDDYDDEDECRPRSHRRSDRVVACGSGGDDGASQSQDASLLDYVNTFLQEGYTSVSAEEVFNVFHQMGQSRSKIECRKIAETIRARASGGY